MDLSTALNALPIGKDAYIKSLDFDTNTARRFLDLGFVRGNRVTSVFKSPLGDPVAYEITGSIIALRHEDAQKIKICLSEEDLLN